MTQKPPTEHESSVEQQPEADVKYVLRRSGEAMKVRDTGEVNEKGFRIMESVDKVLADVVDSEGKPVLDDEGKPVQRLDYARKPVHPDALSDEHQATFKATYEQQQAEKRAAELAANPELAEEQHLINEAALELASDPEKLEFMQEVVGLAEELHETGEFPDHAVVPESVDQVADGNREPQAADAPVEESAEETHPEETSEKPSIASLMGAEEPHETPAQKMRARFEEIKGAEKKAEKEPVIPEEDYKLMHSITDHIGRMSEGLSDPSMREETRHFMDRFIGGNLHEMSAKLKSGDIKGEAYAYITGMMLGATEDGVSLRDIAQEMSRSGQLSPEDMAILNDQFYIMDKMGYLPPEEADETRGRFLFDLEAIAYNVYDRNNLKSSPLYTALMGMVAGSSMLFKGNDRRHYYGGKPYGVLDYLRNMKD